MARCNTCSLLIHEGWYEFFERVGGPERAEAYDYAIYLDPNGRGILPFMVVYCYGQQHQFARLLGSELDVNCVEFYEMFVEEHDCQFHQTSSGHINLQQSIALYEQRRAAMLTPANVQIASGTFIQSQIGTSGSTLNAYIEALQINSYTSAAERELKEALANLRKGIEADELLKQPIKEAAAVDLSAFSEELKKLPAEQNSETKQFFWGRLTDATKLSAALVTLVDAVAKLTGMA